VVARPQIEVAVGVIFHLAAPGEQPRKANIRPSEQHREEEETIVAAEECLGVVVEPL
jgi:hypothetical protein